MLEYGLHDNLLTERTDDCTAIPYSKKNYDLVAFIELMLQRGSTLTKTDLVATMNLMEETAQYIVKEGDQINLPLFNTSFSIPGVFEGMMDSFDPKRHKLRLNVHPGVLLHQAVKEVKLSKVNVPSPQPQILEVKDSVSGQVDEVLTNGGAIDIRGINIKITGDHPDCGLYFFVDGAFEEKAQTIIQNKPSSVIALIPQLPMGGIKIKIVTQFSTGGKNSKEPKTTVFNKIFDIQ